MGFLMTPHYSPQQQELIELYAYLLYLIQDIQDDLSYMRLELESGEFPVFPTSLVFYHSEIDE
jgi:hypothetical protein